MVVVFWGSYWVTCLICMSAKVKRPEGSPARSRGPKEPSISSLQIFLSQCNALVLISSALWRWPIFVLLAKVFANISLVVICVGCFILLHCDHRYRKYLYFNNLCFVASCSELLMQHCDLAIICLFLEGSIFGTDICPPIIHLLK